jgi:glycosyltransferase involved in cell wall biosynthesis
MKILFVIPPADAEAAQFVHSLKNALHGAEVTITDAKLGTLLFEARKYDLVHFFIRPGGKSSQFVRKPGEKARSVQTVLSRPTAKADINKLLFADSIIVLSEGTKKLIERQVDSSRICVIRPCVDLPDPTQLAPSSVVRERFNVGERMLVIVLNDMQNQKEFDSFLYIAREYNRRDVFRFLLPVYYETKAAESWRAKLQYSIGMEKLESVTILKGDQEDHSLIDASDMALLVTRREEDPQSLELPLRGVEALLRGKPVLCFVQSSLSEVIAEFKPNWVTSNTEDFVRESRDIQKEQTRLDEISTELARFARTQFSPSAVAAAHQEIYNRLLMRSPVRSEL